MRRLLSAATVFLVVCAAAHAATEREPRRITFIDLPLADLPRMPDRLPRAAKRLKEITARVERKRIRFIKEELSGAIFVDFVKVIDVSKSDDGYKVTAEAGLTDEAERLEEARKALQALKTPPVRSTFDGRLAGQILGSGGLPLEPYRRRVTWTSPKEFTVGQKLEVEAAVIDLHQDKQGATVTIAVPE